MCALLNSPCDWRLNTLQPFLTLLGSCDSDTALPCPPGWLRLLLALPALALPALALLPFCAKWQQVGDQSTATTTSQQKWPQGQFKNFATASGGARRRNHRMSSDWLVKAQFVGANPCSSTSKSGSPSLGCAKSFQGLHPKCKPLLKSSFQSCTTLKWSRIRRSCVGLAVTESAVGWDVFNQKCRPWHLCNRQPNFCQTCAIVPQSKLLLCCVSVNSKVFWGGLCLE